MPRNADAENPINRDWLVRVAGADGELLIHAAYVVYHDVLETPTVHSAGSGSGAPMASFKDEKHKVVFQMPMAALIYVRQADATRLADRNWTPNQLRDTGAELREAAADPGVTGASHLAAQYTWTRGCDGIHEPGACPVVAPATA